MQIAIGEFMDPENIKDYKDASMAIAKKIVVFVSNVNSGIEKKDVKLLIYYADKTIFGPKDIIASVGARADGPVININVPDGPVESVQFFWEEWFGVNRLHRSVIFNRDSASVNLPWDAVSLTAYTTSLDNVTYEYPWGGAGRIANTKND
ncbi:hypothetical protein [Caballeronia sp. GAOx1]|uniref:hypothetical protein n=1 Tax=Caballeronia sp. GAOx1 TaxID=2921761 RepID=UPI002027DB51|nr:hypothetical protein [Caballeronia sp. GAOx1]